MYNHPSVWLVALVFVALIAHTHTEGTAHHLPFCLTILIDIIRDRFSLFSFLLHTIFLLGTEEKH